MPPKRKAAAGAAAAAAAAGGTGGAAFAGEGGRAYRHCFLQAMMARQYVPESDAKELFRQITGATTGEPCPWLPAHCRLPFCALALHCRRQAPTSSPGCLMFHLYCLYCPPADAMYLHFVAEFNQELTFAQFELRRAKYLVSPARLPCLAP
jgi:hypothetical protein